MRVPPSVRNPQSTQSALVGVAAILLGIGGWLTPRFLGDSLLAESFYGAALCLTVVAAETWLQAAFACFYVKARESTAAARARAGV
jgi:hypothetical protein